jgi:NAD-reducing hydrogenase large subunit
MAKTITIDPVTRIEGHAKITIHLDDQGEVEDAQFHVTQFRGFEKFTEGRRFEEMPSITARICGICPVSHLMASSLAGDDLLAVDVPPAGMRLRRIFNLGQYVQSHALSFFHLTSPDLLLGMDAPVEQRHILGVAAQFPEQAKEGIWLRKFGQRIIEHLSGKRIHPMWTVPGGVSEPLSSASRDEILADLPRAMDITRKTVDLLKSMVDQFEPEIESFGNFPSYFMGLVTPEGHIEHSRGNLRIVDENRNLVADQIPPAAYSEFIGEAVTSFSYLKMPYYKPAGYPGGFYRVGPLARLNVCDCCGTPAADAELEVFRQIGAEHNGAVWESFHFHYARLIEILYALEMIERLLNDPDVLSPHVRAIAGVNKHEGVGISEAPRGTLIHHYRVDDNGLMTWANLIVATGHNNMAMNRGVRDVARRFVHGPENIPEGALNRVEALIRCYDPCLSCSTHAFGQMPMVMEFLDPTGAVVARKERL